MEILDHIPFELDFAEFAARQRVAEGSPHENELRALVDEVVSRVNPKAVYEVSYIQDRSDDTVSFGGATFKSRVLRINLDSVERVFPHIATCGTELEEIELDPGDFLTVFWLDALKEAALNCAIRYLNDYLNRKYVLGNTSLMSPGAGDVDIWPIEQQKPFFSIFGDVESLIGVSLTDSFLMIPNKSVSGIRFPTEIDFRSCQVCQREDCPSRGAPFDRELLESFHADEG